MQMVRVEEKLRFPFVVSSSWHFELEIFMRNVLLLVVHPVIPLGMNGVSAQLTAAKHLQTRFAHRTSLIN